MNSKQFEDSIARVIKHLEGWECYIEVACHENGEFRSMCEDYAVCAHSLESWQASDAAVATQRRKEYTELLAELKQEILSWLDQRYGHDQSDKVIARDPHTT